MNSTNQDLDSRLMTILITGGAGFIGSHILKRLLDEGKRVTIFDNFSTGKRENLAFLKAFDSSAYQPKVGFEEGLKRTVEWYKENGITG